MIPQVKICGLTTPEIAKTCAALGADAIGLVFFPKSPRNVSIDQAKNIAEVVKNVLRVTGVFVNADYDTIMHTVDFCGLHAAQLHGNEPPTLVDRIKQNGIRVVKCLYLESEPAVQKADYYSPDGFLIECAKGILPGGNALSWNFESAGQLSLHKPFAIAGGLSVDNVADAVMKSRAVSVDVSSGVEKAPGVKDEEKIQTFIDIVKACDIRRDNCMDTVF